MAFSYLPQNDDELELKVGDIIEVVGEVRTATKACNIWPKWMACKQGQ